MSSSGRDSRGRRPRGKAVWAPLLVLLTLAPGLGAGPAAGQEPEPPVVAGIVVEVDGRPGEAALFDLIPLKIGEPYSPMAVDQAVKIIFRTGLFSDVRVLKSGDREVVLTFDLTRNLYVTDIKFRGARTSSARLMDGLTSLRPGSVFSEDLVPAAVEEVQRTLRREGFFDAAVEADVRMDPRSASARLEFRVEAWRTYRVRSVSLEGDVPEPEEDLLRRLKCRPGDLYVPARLERGLRSVAEHYASLGYRRAEVRLAEETFDAERDEVLLRIDIQAGERIRVRIEGARVPARLVAPIWDERIFEPWGLDEGEARILNYLRRKGYLQAAVESRIEKSDGEMTIVHEVSRGRKERVERVEFSGLEAFTSDDLKVLLALREGVPLFELLGYDRLFALPSQIESLYKENGFADVHVDLDFAPLGDGVRALYTVREGPQRRIGSIRLDGVSLFDPGELLNGLANKEGGPYFPPSVQRDVGWIESAYLDRGVRGTEVLPRVEIGDDHRVSIVYDITEGEAFLVGNILIAGHRETKRRVIDREILVRRGGVANESLIQESRRRLERLGIFSEVRIEQIPTSPGEEVLVVTVREGEKNYAGIGLGFESRSRLSGSLAAWPDEFRPRGTVEYIRSNVFGLGAQAGLVGQLSTVERRIVASWNQPYLFGLSMPTTLLAWAEREDRVSFKFDRRGVSLNTINSLGSGRLLLAALSLTRTAIFDVSIEDPPDNIDRRYIPYSAAMASLSLSWDKRDDTLNPSRGHYVSLVGEWGFPVFGMESDYQKIYLKSQLYRPLGGGLGLGLTGRLGIGRSLRNLPERFFAGGSNTFRGEEYDMLGPMELGTDGSLKPLGGEAVFLVNTELLLPLVRSWRELRIAAFFDLGNVYGRLDDFKPFDLRGAVGAGIRYRTPLGPVRLEVAWKLWGFDETERKGRPLFFLTIGNIF